MSFKKGANGIESKGKTVGKNLGDSGPTVGVLKSPPKKLGKDQNVMKQIGRNLAKVKNQKAGRGR